MIEIEISLLVFTPVIVFVLIAQRIEKEKQENKKRRHAKYKGSFAKEMWP